MNVSNIGASNSIARYCANADFGDNEWAVFEYVQGLPVMRAAGSKAHCEGFMNADRFLVNVASYKTDRQLEEVYQKGYDECAGPEKFRHSVNHPLYHLAGLRSVAESCKPDK